MKTLTRVGGSIAMLYLVCVLFVVVAVGHAPAAMADDAKKPTPVAEQSVVAEVADSIPDWAEILTTLIALAGVITAATPSPKDNVVLGVVRKVLDVFALNFGGAKNADAQKKT